MFANNVLALATLVSLASAAVVQPAYPLQRRNDTVVTTTKVVSEYTTYCPEPTTFEFNGHTYSVEEPTTLTITDCPCTVTEPCWDCHQPTATAVPPPPPSNNPPSNNPPPSNPPPSNAPEPGPPAPPPATPTPEQPAPPPVSGANGNRHEQYGAFALAGAALIGLVAL